MLLDSRQRYKPTTTLFHGGGRDSSRQEMRSDPSKKVSSSSQVAGRSSAMALIYYPQRPYMLKDSVLQLFARLASRSLGILPTFTRSSSVRGPHIWSSTITLCGIQNITTSQHRLDSTYIDSTLPHSGRFSSADLSTASL